jgi:hypothetical protein
MRDDSLWIGKVSALPFEVSPNNSARELMRLTAAAGSDSSQAVRVCKFSDLSSTQVSNLLVSGSPVHSIVALVQGTQDTELLAASEGFEATRALKSRAVKCVLSQESSQSFNLMAYCHENQLLVYKLDDETAIVLISAVIQEDENTWTLVAERMQKIKDRDIEAIKGNLLAELAMTTEFSAGTSGDGSELTEAARGLRSLKRARTISKWPSSPPRS